MKYNSLIFFPFILTVLFILGNGELVVSCEELSMCKDEMELQFLAKKLDKKDWFGSSDPFLQMSRANEGGGYTVVHRTEHVRNNVNPVRVYLFFYGTSRFRRIVCYNFFYFK